MITFLNLGIYFSIFAKIYLYSARLGQLARKVVHEERQPSECVRVLLVEVPQSQTAASEHYVVGPKNIAATDNLMAIVALAEELKINWGSTKIF